MTSEDANGESRARNKIWAEIAPDANNNNKGEIRENGTREKFAGL